MSYTPPQIPLNLQLADPKLNDLFAAFKQNVMSSINCHAIGTVQSFTQAVTVAADGAVNGLYTVTCKINYSRTYFIKQANGQYRPEQKEYPLLVDVPAIIMGGGSTYLQFPIKQGDQCLILFNDRDLNNWFAGNRGGPVATARMHSLADGIALVGFPNVTSFDPDHALLSNGNAEVGIPTNPADAHVRIANQTTTLYTLLSNLIDAIEGITVNPGSFNVGGTPVTGVSGSVASTTALEAARDALEDLLE